MLETVLFFPTAAPEEEAPMVLEESELTLIAEPVTTVWAKEATWPSNARAIVSNVVLMSFFIFLEFIL